MLYNFFVFFQLKAARAVNEHTAPFQQRYEPEDDFDLPLPHARKICGRQSPAHIDATPHYASVATRSIQQDPIEWRLRADFLRNGHLRPIVANDFRDLNAEAREIFLEQTNPRRLAIARHDQTPV